MTPKEINLLLDLRDIKPTKLADEIGVSKGDLSATIRGLRRNSAIRKKLAARLGMPEEELFGASHDRAVAEKDVA